MLLGQPLPRLSSCRSAGRFAARADDETVRGEGESATSDLKDCQLPALLGAGVGGQLPLLCLC